MIYTLVLVLIFLSPQITTTQNTTEDSKSEIPSNESSKLKENGKYYITYINYTSVYPLIWVKNKRGKR